MSDRLKMIESVDEPVESLESSPLLTFDSPSLLQAILESYLEGVLIVSESGRCLYANERARRVCRLLNPKNSRFNAVPEEIWQVCLSVIESRFLFPNQRIIIESEIFPLDSNVVYIQVQWFQLVKLHQDCLLVLIEDLTEVESED